MNTLEKKLMTPEPSATPLHGAGCLAGMGLPGSQQAGLHHPVIISLENVRVEFAGFRALDIASFYLDRGELRFVIGPNGAGKTTLLDVICRKVTPVAGTVLFDGNTEIKYLDIAQVARLGLVRKFQAPSIFPQLRVSQNMELAFPRSRTVWSGFSFKLKPQERERIEAVLTMIGLLDRRSDLAADLSHGQKQWLELGMTIMQNPKLLMVDEPVAGMSESEREKTGQILTEVAKTCSVLVVEHDMKFVSTFARMVTVLHEGRVLCEGDFATVSANPTVIDIYLGRGKKA